MFYNKVGFRRVDRIVSQIAVTTAAQNVLVNGKDIRINSVTGNTWINPKGTAAATGGTSYQIVPGGFLEMNVDGNLSIISDATGSTVQIIVYE